MVSSSHTSFPTAKNKVLLNIQRYKTSSKSMIKAVEELSRLPKEQMDEVDVGNVHKLLTSLTYGSSGADLKRSCNGLQPSYEEEDLVPLMPDPDLVVVVGDHLTSNGFPCWFWRCVKSSHQDSPMTTRLPPTHFFPSPSPLTSSSCV